MIKQMKACGNQSPECDEALFDKYYDELCKKYNVPKDPKTGICGFHL